MSGLDNTSYTLRTVATNGASDSLTATDSVLVLSGTGAKAVALASGALTIPGRQYTVVNTGASGDVTITPAAGTIAGASTLVLVPGSGSTFVNDGTNWIQISDLTPPA